MRTCTGTSKERERERDFIEIERETLLEQVSIMVKCTGNGY